MRNMDGVVGQTDWAEANEVSLIVQTLLPEATGPEPMRFDLTPLLRDGATAAGSLLNNAATNAHRSFHEGTTRVHEDQVLDDATLMVALRRSPTRSKRANPCDCPIGQPGNVALDGNTLLIHATPGFAKGFGKTKPPTRTPKEQRVALKKNMADARKRNLAALKKAEASR